MLKFSRKLAAQAVTLLGLVLATSVASAQNWVDQSPMNEPRVEATTVDYRNNIYVFNGFKLGLHVANSVEKYDSATKQWTKIASSTTMNGTAMTHNGG